MRGRAIFLALLSAPILAGCFVLDEADAQDSRQVASEAPADVAANRAQEVIAAERAFSARAGREGQWTAFRATAAPNAYMFTPDPVMAQQWLARRPDPSESVVWWPERIIIACDGSLAASLGGARWPGGRYSRFITIWQRQADGTWHWLADDGADVAGPLVEPADVAVEAADCPGAIGPEPQPIAEGQPAGASTDQTLLWDWVNTPAQRGLRVTIWVGTRYAVSHQPDRAAP